MRSDIAAKAAPKRRTFERKTSERKTPDRAQPNGRSGKATLVTTAPRVRAKSTRAERVEATRRALILAATEVIGEVGYERASISRITSRAKVAQGTFYTYFQSRQDLFDRLLPDVGQDMLASIAAAMHGARDLLDVEERGFRHLFKYVARHPGFYRLLNEAETLAPKAHRTHFRNLTKGYIRSLHLAQSNGELRDYSAREVEVLAYMLMGIRSYLILGFARRGSAIRELPEWVTQTYLKFVRRALADPIAVSPRPTRRPA